MPKMTTYSFSFLLKTYLIFDVIIVSPFLVVILKFPFGELDLHSSAQRTVYTKAGNVPGITQYHWVPDLGHRCL